ncbi:MAG: InlB B-repeat-containing protein, partial [Eggerthellaceae bacterium]|nr:InlB B-repeat-containing protein [Eggerthellaceae bacterium]
GEVIDVTEAVTAVAQWEPTEAPEEVEAPIVITFDGNGGEGEMEAAEPDEEGKYELPECGFTAPEGMGFAGWLVGEETCQAGEVIDVTEAVTAVAQWQEPAPEENAEAEGGEDDEAAPEDEEDTGDAEAAQTYMILFDENGGTGDMPIEEVAGGSAYSLPVMAYMAPEGTAFAGWQTGDGIHMPGETVTVSEDTLLKAVWEPIEAETPEATEPEQTATEPEQAETEPVEPEAPEATEPEQAETEPEQAEAEATEPEQTEIEPVEPEASEATEPEQAEAEPEQTEAEASEPVPAEAGPEQAETEPEQAEAEPEAAPAEEAPERTISFDGGGGTGEMGSESAADGSEYTLPACGFEIEGAVFDCWEISGNNVSAPYTAKAGETIVVDGDLTATAMWTIDESAGGPEATDAEADEAQAPEAEGAPEAEEAPDEADDGLNVEYEAVPEENTTGKVEEEAGEADEDAAIEATTEEAPSEVGTIFGGAGTAAIVAAIALILAAVGITIARKKKK